MKLRPGLADVYWMLAGAATLSVVVLVVLRFQSEPSVGVEFMDKVHAIDLVEGMQLALASASDAEKSAVLATTDGDARSFAEQALQFAADVERQRLELSQMLDRRGDARERDLLGRFSEAFTEFQAVDRELLPLAMENSNLEASNLAFGPAAAAVAAIDAALQRIEQRAVADGASDVVLLASDARISAWRILALLPPHIAEESDEKMDEIEARIAEEQVAVRRCLDGIAPRRDTDFEVASTRSAELGEVVGRIVALSRFNTEVHAFSLSLGRKRGVMVRSREALDALQRAIFDVRVPGFDYARPSNPRHL